MLTKVHFQTTEDLTEVLKSEIKRAERTIESCTEELSNGKDPKWFIDDLQKARATKIEAARALYYIEDNPEALFEDHIKMLRRQFVSDVITTLGFRNLMNSTSNAGNMASLHELTAKAALATEFFEDRAW